MNKRDPWLVLIVALRFAAVVLALLAVLLGWFPFDGANP